ncbi:hypothetical protein [Allorhodopirellula heiligendammensis]|nr:hypothetical protein [Allorhodopirellula heiligendammensis]
MRKPTIRYVLIATAVMAACLAVHQIPFPRAVVIEIGEPVPDPPPFRPHHILSWWLIRAGTYVVGISTLMHVLTSLIGLSGWRQWMAATCVPTFALTAWYSYSVRYLNHHPGSLNEWDHVQIGLIGFTVGFAVVTFAVALPALIADQRVAETQDGTEQKMHVRTGKV